MKFLASQTQNLASLLSAYFKPNVLKMGFLWVCSGIPFMLTGSTLGVLLKEYGFSYTALGLFSWLHMPYALKFLWAPLVDHLKIPFLSQRLGPRRAWLFVSQGGAAFALFLLSWIDPGMAPGSFITLSFSLAFLGATSEMILLPYQMEILPFFHWGIGESMSIFSYRIGLLLGGALALAMSASFPWPWVYFLFSLFLMTGPLMVLALPRPLKSSSEVVSCEQDPPFFQKAIWAPLKDFISRPGGGWILGFMLLFRLQDALVGGMISLFYLDLGFSKGDIANCQKVFGLWMTIFGGFLGGMLLRAQGYFRALWIGGLAHALSGLCYVGQAWAGASLPLLYLTTGIEDVTKGIAMVAFFSYQLTCCKKKYAVTQLALLTALTHLGQVILSSFSGFLVDLLAWKNFFLFTTFFGFLSIFWIKGLPPLERRKENLEKPEEAFG